MSISIGERFELPEESIYGVVSEIFYDDDFEAKGIVVDLDDGCFAAIDMSLVERVRVH